MIVTVAAAATGVFWTEPGPLGGEVRSLEPREIAFLQMPGFGINRLWWPGGRYAYVAAHFDGFIDHILCIVDLKNITKPEELVNAFLEHDRGGWLKRAEDFHETQGLTYPRNNGRVHPIELSKIFKDKKTGVAMVVFYVILMPFFSANTRK